MDRCPTDGSPGCARGRNLEIGPGTPGGVRADPAPPGPASDREAILPSRNRPPGPGPRQGPGGRFELVALVEAVGIEPTSGNPPRQASTSIAGCLVLSPPIPPTGWLSGRPAPKSLAPHPRAGCGASPRNMTSEPAPR